MKRVYTNDNVVLVGHLHSLLEANNIACHLRNINLTSGIGELPINECWPEIWIHDEANFNIAEKIIEDALSAATQHEAWQCLCGEKIDGQFDTCWSCGKTIDSQNTE